ncbi:hypothetical protein T06_7446 [Trichinella sp. T6]|nr:hypothetical protein T06_7446 [Trichinella sp. T6]
MVILRCRELFVALFDSHRSFALSWFEYRIEIKKEPDQHISQEQPVSHRRMAIFDCMPVEITVAIESKSNKKGVTHIMCTLAEEWLCGIGFRSAVMTTRERSGCSKENPYGNSFIPDENGYFWGSHPCRQLSSRASFTILPSPGQLLVMNSRTVVSSGNIRPIKLRCASEEATFGLILYLYFSAQRCALTKRHNIPSSNIDTGQGHTVFDDGE